MFVELVPSLRCSRGTISCFPFCVAFVFVVCLDECHTWRTRSGQCCVFPDLWRGSLYHSCTRYSPTDYRCSLTADIESDGLEDSCDGKQPFSADDHAGSPHQGYPGPASAACFPSCGREEGCTTAASGATPLPFFHWRRITCLITRETGVTVSQHSQWTAIPWDCTVKQATIARWTTCAFEHFMTSLPLSTIVQKNRAPFC